MRVLDRLSDRDLFAATRDGQAEAFGLFYRRHHELLLVFLGRRTRDPELAADLMAEVFAAILLAVHERGEEVTEPLALLYTTARHKLIDAHRRGQVASRAREALGIGPDHLEDEDLARINALTSEDRVLDLLERLPPDEREAVRARVLESRDYPEIAARIETSDLVVRQRVSRGLRRLRSLLNSST